MVTRQASHLVSRIRTKIRGAVIGVVLVLVASMAIAPLPANTAHAQLNLSNLTSLTSGYGSNSSTCAIETVGWVICPVMRSIAKIADYSFAFINVNYLSIDYDIRSTDSGTYKAWNYMRNFANALFVIAFLVVIYAQITGKGEGGYNIKRLLPRLIFAAILINTSYFICIIFIEISNIIGTVVMTQLSALAAAIGQPAMTLTSAANNFTDQRLSDITSGILTKSGTVWILLAPVAAITISIAVVCSIGLVVLIMRKVVVAMLVLISPFVFVLYLLPNTEKYFQQWSQLFFQMLLIFPVLAFLLGTGQIVSATIVTVGSGGDTNYSVNDDSYSGKNAGSGHATTDLAASGAAVLPLLGAWFVMKSVSQFATSTSARVAGSLGNRRSKNQEAKIKAQMENAQKPQGGINGGLPVFDRKPAFTRANRRRRLPSEGVGASSTSRSGQSSKPLATSQSGSANATSGSSMFDRLTGNIGKAQSNNATLDGQLDKEEQDVNAKLAEAQSAIAVKDDAKKGKTAKDIFNNMNKSRQMGGASQSGAPQAQAQPSAPSQQYQAPVIASQGNTAPAQPAVIAVPVQVDASTFTNSASSHAAPPGMMQPPISDTQKKAKARAQKYIFDSADDLEKSNDQLDDIREELTKSHESDKDTK